MTGCTAFKSLEVQPLRHCLPTESAYSALQRSVQQEWQVLQRTTTNIESCVDLIEKAMKVEFLPARFGEATDGADYRLARAHTFQ